MSIPPPAGVSCGRLLTASLWEENTTLAAFIDKNCRVGVGRCTSLGQSTHPPTPWSPGATNEAARGGEGRGGWGAVACVISLAELSLCHVQHLWYQHPSLLPFLLHRSGPCPAAALRRYPQVGPRETCSSDTKHAKTFQKSPVHLQGQCLALKVKLTLNSA